ncbi:MAG: nucleotide sugar dehydrogenase [Planctomycetaceae bacterium]
MRITCLGAGYVGGPTMAMIAAQCPDIQVTVVDHNAARIAAWNSDRLPVYEPGLDEVVRAARGRNLHFHTDVENAIRSADLKFLCDAPPTNPSGVGAGRAADLRYIERAARTIAEVSEGPKIVVEKSTIPVKTAEALLTILRSNSRHGDFQVLSNPEFLAEGTAVADLRDPERILIGGERTPAGEAAMATLADIYARWVPRERILTTNLWSSELSKLVANAFLAQRISSINSISALCEATGADVGEVADAIGRDSRIGPKFLRASVGFGGSCFRKDILNLVYLCEHFGLPEVAGYWERVVRMNDWQKDRFTRMIVSTLFNTVSEKRIAVLGFAFKKDTNDTRDSPAIAVVRGLLEENATVAVYDPKVPAEAIRHEVLGPGGTDARLVVATSAAEAAAGAHALAVLTEWDEFRSLDFVAIHAGMHKPACVFDGRNILPRAELERIGYRVFSIGKPASA